jgi:hypothetical protein
MLAVFLAILAAVSASPSPSPAPTPALKTIVTVKSTSFCGEFAAHANAMIGSATENDATLGDLILTLKASDLAGSQLERRNESHRLISLGDDIYKQFRKGMAEAGHLRSMAAVAKSADERAALKASADALAGALYRQHLIQRDLDGFVAYLEAADMRNDSVAVNALEQDQNRSDTMSGPWLLHHGYDYPNGVLAQSLQAWNNLAGDESPREDVRMAATASRDFQRRLPSIVKDELTAGARFQVAASHC